EEEFCEAIGSTSANACADFDCVAEFACGSQRIWRFGGTEKADFTAVEWILCGELVERLDGPEWGGQNDPFGLFEWKSTSATKCNLGNLLERRPRPGRVLLHRATCA